MTKYQKIAFLFPGQGAQYLGMGRDFVEEYAEARRTLEEAEDLLGKSLRKILFEGSESELKETQNSQVGIYVISTAILRVLQKQFPVLQPAVCAGLSLGEYTALTASDRLSFSECLPLVQKRAQFMNDACEAFPGTMAVVLGLSATQVEEIVHTLNMPRDLWVANLNCPGQVVVSGTQKGIDAAKDAAEKHGAKRVLPLQVHGAFHSGLMQEAQDRLAVHIEAAPLQESSIDMVMNVPGDFVRDPSVVRQHLIQQVTHPVRWEQSIRAMGNEGVDLFVEIGCGKTLTGLNKKIGLPAPTYNIDKIEDLKRVDEQVS